MAEGGGSRLSGLTGAREEAKAVEAGSRRQETVDGGREPVKVDEEGGPG